MKSAAIVLIASGIIFGGPALSQTASYTYKVVHVFPHDRTAFTEGLEYRNGFLYESTGQSGRSSIRQIRLDTGEVVRKIDLPAPYFGEGITLLNNEIVQLTWQSQTGFVYSAADFRRLRSFSYPGEGWALANNGREIFLSDGTPEIRVLNPHALRETRRITVHEGGARIDQVNELEFVNGEIFANIWHADKIARISPRTGAVVGWIDMSGLLSPLYRAEPEAVLNGIAWDAAGKRLFVTGKLWPNIFEIQVIPSGAGASRKKPR